MAEVKQVPLNGAYYGPPIPPQQGGYRQHGRQRTGTCSCLMSTFFKLVFSIIIALGVAVLVLWLIYRPHKMRVYVATAELSQFNLNGNTLNYSLSLNVAIRNPNKRIGIYYDKLEARAYYEGERFGYSPLPTFYQGHKNTTNVFPVFTGQATVPFSNGDLETFNREKGEGFFYIDVKIDARIRYKVGSVKTRRYKPDFECDLRLPVPVNGGSTAAAFSSTKCDVDF
ncbi:hypothetical protein ACLOJK_006007 [Asimina triloba]